MNILKERYRLFDVIGKGGFYKTFLAVDEGKFPPVSCVVQEFWLQNQSFECLQRKAQVLVELGKHPQIPTVFDFFLENDCFYLVQEFVAGSNLASLIEEEGVFSESQIWQLLEDILPVLKFIHDCNMIHCNIKPENIILRFPLNSPLQKWDVVLVNFGTAQLMSNIESPANTRIIGSPEYAAPEQAQGKPVFASDIYSLGVTCIYLLTHIPPFDLFDVANNGWAWQDYLTTKVSDRLTKILDKLLQNAVNRRFQSASEVMEAMGVQSKIQNLKSKIQNPLWRCSHTFNEHSAMLGGVNAIAINPDGNILASGHDHQAIALWDLNTKKILSTLSGHSQAVKSVAFSPDGKILASASDDKTIKLWNIDTFEEIFTLKGHSRAVKSVAFSPTSLSPPFQGGILATGSWDKTVKLWDVNTGEEISTLTGHQLQVSSVAFSPDGKFLASASYDRTIRLWKLSEKVKNRPYYTFSGHAWAVLTVAFSPDGKMLVTGSEDNTIKLWELNTGQLIRTLCHSWSVVTVAFSADGETLISGSWDKTVKLWKVSDLEEMATLSGHIDAVSAVAVSPVARVIASGSRDKTIKLWQFVEQQGS
jgi:serine/threonine protein kinase